jgi:ribosome-associated heat shock protein Hsp15
MRWGSASTPSATDSVVVALNRSGGSARVESSRPDQRYRLVERWLAFSSRAILERVADPLATDETRVDRWLCAVRLVKTRPLATRSCEGGHVLVNGLPAKPSTRVRAGDRVEALIADRRRIVEVVRPIESRVGALVAATCYVDHSPPVVPEAGTGIMPMRGEGRPSKRLRRELERMRRAPDA